MKIKKSILMAAVFLISAAAASAQGIIQVKPNEAGPPQQSDQEITDDELARFVFDPVTDSLNLTPAQRYRIALIASSTMAGTKPLFEQIDELDNQISIAAFSGGLDETRLKELSSKQAGVMSDISATIARAKASFYKVLTPEQRAIVLAHYRLSEQSLGALSNVGP
jgi:Spy/CpxP family protein refolding chaperone